MIYTAENTIGKPVRVFVDGVEIDKAIMADTDRGVVEFYTQPLKVVDGNIETQLINGHVEVRPL